LEESLKEIKIESAHDTLDLDIVMMLFLMLIVGGLMKDIAAYIKLPYTSLITVLGVILGIIAEA